ncbi:MAG: hypothetical protein HC820_00365 [Hydrococcus sp. RM1_1_31]|nr:hypothetical protein [Hydrococcus sp. RM1_1_31]
MLAIRKNLQRIIENFPDSCDSADAIVLYLEKFLNLGLEDNDWFEEDEGWEEFISSDRAHDLQTELSNLLEEEP